MKTSPKIHNGPRGGGTSIPKKPLTHSVCPMALTCNKRKKLFSKKIIQIFVRPKGAA